MLKVLLTQYPEIEDLFCCASSCPEASLFFCNNFLHLWLQSVQYDLQHDFALVVYWANGAVVLALLYVAVHGEGNDQ